MDATRVALQRPVGHPILDEGRVGDDDVDVVVGANTRRAWADLRDGAAHPALELDIVSDRDHPVEDQEQAGDELLDHALEPQANPYPDGPGENGQR